MAASCAAVTLSAAVLALFAWRQRGAAAPATRASDDSVPAQQAEQPLAQERAPLLLAHEAEPAQAAIL
jgi:hypothetical protein